MTFRALKPSHNSSTKVPNLCPMFVGIRICLSQLLCRASQMAAVLGSCLQPQHNIINSVRNWCLPIGWISTWPGHWSAIPSVSAPFLSMRFQSVNFKKASELALSHFLRWNHC